MNQISLEEQISMEEQIKEWNDTSCPYEASVCIHEKLEDQSKKTPSHIALTFNETDFSYKELNDAANALANILLEKGIHIEDNVIVHLEKSIELMISIFGILKAGGVYVPLSSNYPEERIHYIVNESRPKLVLTSKQHIAHYKNTDCEVIILDDFLYAYRNLNLEKPAVKVSSRNLAYIIYTSGTSGNPKGVLIEHHSVLNRIGWMQKKFPIDETDVLIQKTSITFDVSIWELFWWTFVGARLIILPEGDEKKPDQIINCIRKYQVSIIHFVPSMFNVFVDVVKKNETTQQINSLRWIFCSGEELKATAVAKFYQTIHENQHTTIVNLYGPTEATVDVTYHTCIRKPYDIIPIGKPIDNTEIYIIDEHKNILPFNAEGELIICGVNLSRGYLNQKELSSEKFIKLKLLGETKRAYRTGDLAYINDGGEVIFKGRIDHQIKLRGYRIELSEIENTVLKHNGIAECSCILCEKNKDTAHIVCFMVATESHDIEIDSLKEYLKRILPDYAIPSRFKKVNSLPLSTSGKIDRTKLQELAKEYSPKKEFTSLTQIEKKIQEIWSDLLNRKSIPADMNFFELGGNSLLLIQLSLLVKEKLNVTISPISIFEYPTIKEFSKYISTFI
jgi:amino acid adenylation domain-containing protein